MDEKIQPEDELQQADVDDDDDTTNPAASTEQTLAQQGRKERTELAKRYLHPFIREADAKMAKLPGLRKGEQSATFRALMRGAERMERTALMEVLFLYSFSGMSTREIADHMAIDRRLIKRVMLDPRYAQAYDLFKREIVGKIADALTQRVSETMIDALELKITLMKKAKSEWLKNQIANEILEMGKEITHGKGSGLSDQLTAIWQRAIKKSLPDGTTVTETQTLTKAVS